MAMAPESKVKDKVKKILKSLGAYYTMPMGTGYGNAGVPDFIVCHKGRFIGVECKAGAGKTTALQEKNLHDIETAGGVSMVVNESNLDVFQSTMQNLCSIN